MKRGILPARLKRGKHHWFRCVMCRRDVVVEPVTSAPACDCGGMTVPVNAEPN